MIADSLSRDSNLSDNYLASLLASLFPQQVLKNIHIIPLSPIIISWINYQLLETPARLSKYPALIPILSGCGYDGKHSSNVSRFPMPVSSTTLTPTKGYISLVNFSKSSENESSNNKKPSLLPFVASYSTAP